MRKLILTKISFIEETETILQITCEEQIDGQKNDSPISREDFTFANITDEEIKTDIQTNFQAKGYGTFDEIIIQ